MLYVGVICFQAALLDFTLLPTGCEHSQESASAIALDTQLELVWEQLTLSLAAATCAARA